MQKEEDADKIFALVGEAVNKITGNPPADKKPEKLEAEIKKNIFHKSFTEGFAKTNFDSIQGLIPYETFIVTNSKGEIKIGVLAYTTPRSLQLARDLAQGYHSKAAQNTKQCKSTKEIAKSLNNEVLLSRLGIKYFYNKNCRPSLLAYGIGFICKRRWYECRLSLRSKRTSKRNGRWFYYFIFNSDVNAFIKDAKMSQKTIDAMMKATKIKENTNYGGSVKRKRTSMAKEMSKVFSSSASINLRGLQDARIWSVDKGDYMIVGVMRYYSMDSIEKANRQFDPKPETKTNATPKQNKPSLQHSNNLDVDDF